ncbi:MAG: DUF4440 domain-containing protein [Candidatus Eremiobacteraeota bacterium]|nr:DUF4440 domain-containing protein [Candidatus Eremiobacteraeota bacterium]
MIASMLLAALVTVLPASPATANPPVTPDAALMPSINQLLNAYSAKDVDGVLAMLASPAAVYGSAEKEVYTTPDGFATLLSSDYRQWDSSRFGEPFNMNVRTFGDTATAFFDAPFTMNIHGQVVTVTIRFATVWVLQKGQWRLAQIANFAPTR